MDINTVIKIGVVAYTIWYIFYLVNRDIKNTKRIDALENGLQETNAMNRIMLYLLLKAGSLGDYEAELKNLTKAELKNLTKAELKNLKNMGDRG